jgi:rRNA processing protein Krr1/Pno1
MPTNTIPGMAPAQAKAGAKGVSQSAAADVERILAMKAAGVAVEEKKEEGPSSTATVHVPEKRVGIVIGPKGAKIKMIQEKTGVSRIDTTGELFTIMGEPKAVAAAETAIKELVEKGYCALQYDDFSENFVQVHPSYFPDLIGKQGAVVRKIKEELGVEVNFPETQKNAQSSKKYKVGLAGSTQAVEKAKNVINNIMMYSHDELTHPGEVHAELEIEAWAWRYIIGTAGSEMKHIQNNFKVKVCIPRDYSLNQQVLVVGEAGPVDRARTYIEKLVWNAEHKTSGRDKVDDGDAWGDEAPEEEWMKQYMYKR